MDQNIGKMYMDSFTPSEYGRTGTAVTRVARGKRMMSSMSKVTKKAGRKRRKRCGGKRRKTAGAMHKIRRMKR